MTRILMGLFITATGITSAAVMAHSTANPDMTAIQEYALLVGVVSGLLLALIGWCTALGLNLTFPSRF